MAFWNRKKSIKKEQAAVLQHLDGKRVAYAVSRDSATNAETVLGKNGSVNLINDEIAVLCEGKYVFRGKLQDCQIGELMSRNGVTIRGANQVDGGKQAAVTAYYTYHRK